MKIIVTQYEKIGRCDKLEDGRYTFYGEYSDMGNLIFKDGETFAKHWNEPCYMSTDDFSNSTQRYETHTTLLEQCNYNEQMCQCMFKQLDGEMPAKWLDTLKSEDYEAFYSFVKVGSEVFLHKSPYKRIPVDFYKVIAIEDTPENWMPDTSVILEVEDVNGETMEIETFLCELSQTDIKQKIAKWGKS